MRRNCTNIRTFRPGGHAKMPRLDRVGGWQYKCAGFTAAMATKLVTQNRPGFHGITASPTTVLGLRLPSGVRNPSHSLPCFPCLSCAILHLDKGNLWVYLICVAPLNIRFLSISNHYITGSGIFINGADMAYCPPLKYLCYYVSSTKRYSFGHIFTIPLRPRAKTLRTYCMFLTLEHKTNLNKENRGRGKAIFSYTALWPLPSPKSK